MIKSELEKFIVRKGKELCNEDWTLVEDEDIINRAKFAITGCEENKFQVLFVAQVFDLKKYAICLSAGKKSDGKWNEYFTDAVSIINRLTSKDKDNFLYIPQKDPIQKGLFKTINVGKMFKTAWMINWTNLPEFDWSQLYIGVAF